MKLTTHIHVVSCFHVVELHLLPPSDGIGDKTFRQIYFELFIYVSYIRYEYDFYACAFSLLQ
jgi:hypothetical protein